MTTTKGLLLTVSRPADFPDCTNGGISSWASRLILVGTIVDGALKPLPAGSQVFDAGGQHPAVALEMTAGTAHLVPVDDEGQKVAGWVQSGGNHATGDSRFTEAVEQLIGQHFYGAVSIHDRIEEWQ
jgi:hypothetical protein